MTDVSKPSEFTRIITEFPKAIDRQVQNYPLISAIAAVALTILGLLLVMKFSVVTLVAGALLLGGVGLIAKGAMSDPDAWIAGLKSTVLGVFSKNTTSNPA